MEIKSVESVKNVNVKCKGNQNNMNVLLMHQAAGDGYIYVIFDDVFCSVWCHFVKLGRLN